MSNTHARLEGLATLLMAIATIATAWCAYQSTVFSSEEEFALHDAEEINRQVHSTQARATQLRLLDVNLFSNWANAYVSGSKALQDFYTDRFPPRLSAAFKAWMEQDPFNNPKAAKHPLIVKEYQVAEDSVATDLEQQYKKKLAVAYETNSHSEHYVLLTVIMASILFFGGIASNIQQLSTKKALVIASALILFATIVWMATFPVILR